MRKLASVQKISNISPIPGADNIERADILGWSVVVKKDEFKVGDLAVYFEIDSWLDEKLPAMQSPVFIERFTNWQDPEGNMRRGMRLRTIKLRKQLSQGLILDIGDFPELSASVRGLDKLSEGDDVTEILKIEKWEPFEEQKGNNGGLNKAAGMSMFPSFLRKSDQERIQNYCNELSKHDGETFEVTIKLDGSSMTVFHVSKSSPYFAHCLEDMEKRWVKRMTFFQKLWYKTKKRFGFIQVPDNFSGVCSRNIQLPLEESNHFSQYVRDNKLVDKLAAYGQNVALQGELIAPTIQGNYEKMESFGFFVYDVFDIDTQAYLLPAQAKAVAEALNVSYVPVLKVDAKLADYGYLESQKNDPEAVRKVVDNILAFAEGPGMNPGVKREGVVFKSNSSPFSFKAISNSYLLKKKD